MSGYKNLNARLRAERVAAGLPARPGRNEVARAGVSVSGESPEVAPAPARKFLPWTHLTLNDARSKLAGWHFAKESLSDGEREILYVAEAVLRELDASEPPAKPEEETR